MKKQLFIRSIVAGDTVDDIFVLAEKKVSLKKNGDSYLNLKLADASGEIKGVVWDNVEEITAAAAAGDFVRISGSVSEYRGTNQVTVRRMTCCARDGIDPADFLPVTAHDTDKMFQRLRRTVDASVKDTYIKALLDAFWQDEEFVRRFKTAPGGTKMHHAYIGGLLEHTLSLIVLVEKIAEHYTRKVGNYNGINLDLLLAGAILHDIGKTRELEYEYRIGYSSEGQLLSHIVIGCCMIDEKIRQIDGFPEETAALLKHMIVSHHGCREFGSPEPPKTLEAVLLSHIDDIDAKMNGIREFIANEDAEAEWTSYNPMLRRNLYLTGRKEDGTKGSEG